MSRIFGCAHVSSRTVPALEKMLGKRVAFAAAQLTDAERKVWASAISTLLMFEPKS